MKLDPIPNSKEDLSHYDTFRNTNGVKLRVVCTGSLHAWPNYSPQFMARLPVSSSLGNSGTLDIEAGDCIAAPAAASSVVIDKCWFQRRLKPCKVKGCTHRKLTRMT